MKRFGILTATVILAATITACGDNKSTPPLGPSRSSFVLDNWHAIKLPIHVTLSQADAHFADRPDGSCDVTQGIRGTAWDANGRQLADSLGQWSSDNDTLATVDSLGWVTPKGCGQLPQLVGVLDSAGIRFTLTNSK